MSNFLQPIRTLQDGDDPINHWKRQIGFSEEPTQDAQGYWTIGYGQRLNDSPGGPKPYATVSEPIAHDELSYFMDQGGDPSTRLPSPQMPTVDEAVTSALGKDPGINYRGTQVRFTGDVPREDIAAIFDDLDKQPSPNRFLGFLGSTLNKLNNGLDSIPGYGDERIKRRKEEEERINRLTSVGGTR